MGEQGTMILSTGPTSSRLLEATRHTTSYENFQARTGTSLAARAGEDHREYISSLQQIDSSCSTRSQKILIFDFFLVPKFLAIKKCMIDETAHNQ